MRFVAVGQIFPGFWRGGGTVAGVGISGGVTGRASTGALSKVGT